VHSYGIAVLFGFLCGWRLLRLNLIRYGLESGIADKMILATLVAGLLGSKIYHDAQNASRVLADPGILTSPSGFAWAGGLVAGIASLFLLARHLKLSPLLLMDAAAPSAAIGYALGRVGCFLSGDGDYGVQTSLPWGMSFPYGLVPTQERVHPTPIYEAIAATLICWYLCRFSRPETARGHILARYLVLSGASRLLVEFIRINPRSFFGFTNAQAVSALCIIAGVALLGRPPRHGDVKPSAESARIAAAFGRKSREVK
jgi:phosphatidylglycerol:prolipoprotein diacylglycerol transferase